MHLLAHRATCTPAVALNTVSKHQTHTRWTNTPLHTRSSCSLLALLAACHHRADVLRYGQVQMALSRLSPNRVSQNTPVTAGTCAPSQSGAAKETNYQQQFSRCRVHGARASPSPYKAAEARRQIHSVVSVWQLGERDILLPPSPSSLHPKVEPSVAA